jgi:lysophospholipase L1-like esterase
MKIRSGATVLFQGDSITDAGRDYWDLGDLGAGYEAMVSEWFSGKHPETDVVFVNRGVSADRIRDLKERWQEDCLDLKPDVVSILVGINDAFAGLFWDEPTSIESFEADYASVLELTRANLDAQLVLMEPFLLPVSEDVLPFMADVDSRSRVVGKLAKEFGAVLVPLGSIFAEAAKLEAPKFYSLDGVHPTQAGHELIARSWLKSTESF